VQICSLLLKHGAKLEATDNEGKTALMNAVYNEEKEAVALLIEQGAQLDAKEPNGWSALMLAAMGGDPEIAGMLIKSGADVHAKTKDGETPLARAMKLDAAGMGSGYKEIVTLLKEAGAN